MKNEYFSRSAPVSEQAAAWFLAFESGDIDEDGHRQFVDWLKSAPVNIQEFLAIATLHLEVSQSPRLAATIDELVSEARANVVVLDEAVHDAEPAADGKTTPRRFLWAVAASVVLGIAATLAFVLTPGSQGQVFRTARGEQRSIALEDGSLVVLNTLSEIRVDYTSSRRAAVLVTGEALFDVEEDLNRPFTVEAGSLLITVTGTRFNVYRQEVQTVLTVVEGEVEAAPTESAVIMASDPAPADEAPSSPLAEDPVESAPTAVVVAAGEQVTMASDGAVIRETEVNVERATAWTQRRLIFDNEPLELVSQEFNRYNSRHLIIENPELASRRVTGVINAHDGEALVAFLEGQPGIRVRHEPDAIRVSSASHVVP